MKYDVHGTFAGWVSFCFSPRMSFEAAFFGTDCHTNVFQRRPYSLVLMTYHGVVLLMSGYQANADKILDDLSLMGEFLTFIIICDIFPWMESGTVRIASSCHCVLLIGCIFVKYNEYVIRIPTYNVMFCCNNFAISFVKRKDHVFSSLMTYNASIRRNNFAISFVKCKECTLLTYDTSNCCKQFVTLNGNLI